MPIHEYALREVATQWSNEFVWMLNLVSLCQTYLIVQIKCSLRPKLLSSLSWHARHFLVKLKLVHELVFNIYHLVPHLNWVELHLIWALSWNMVHLFRDVYKCQFFNTFAIVHRHIFRDLLGKPLHLWRLLNIRLISGQEIWKRNRTAIHIFALLLPLLVRLAFALSEFAQVFLLSWCSLNRVIWSKLSSQVNVIWVFDELLVFWNYWFTVLLDVLLLDWLHVLSVLLVSCLVLSCNQLFLLVQLPQLILHLNTLSHLLLMPLINRLIRSQLHGMLLLWQLVTAIVLWSAAHISNATCLFHVLDVATTLLIWITVG